MRVGVRERERGEDGDEDGVPIYRWAAAMLIKHPFICNPLSDERSLFHVQTGLVVFDQRRLPALTARSGSRAVLSLGWNGRVCQALPRLLPMPSRCEHASSRWNQSCRFHERKRKGHVEKHCRRLKALSTGGRHLCVRPPRCAYNCPPICADRPDCHTCTPIHQCVHTDQVETKMNQTHGILWRADCGCHCGLSPYLLAYPQYFYNY